MIDDVAQAQHDTVRDFRHGDRRGAVALAPLVGMNATILSNKVNPNQEGHYLGLIESIPLQLISRDFRIYHRYSHALGHVGIRLGDYTGVSDMQLLNAYAEYHAEIGETADTIRRALADQHISRQELADIRREGHEDITAFFEMMARLEALVDD